MIEIAKFDTPLDENNLRRYDMDCDEKQQYPI